MMTGQPLSLTGTGSFRRTAPANDAIPTYPQWLKYDR